MVKKKFVPRVETLYRLGAKTHLMPFSYDEATGTMVSSKIRYWYTLIITIGLHGVILAFYILNVSPEKMRNNPYYLIGVLRQAASLLAGIIITCVQQLIHYNRTLETINKCISLEKRSQSLRNIKDAPSKRTHFIIVTLLMSLSFTLITVLTVHKIYSLPYQLAWLILVPTIYATISPDGKIYHLLSTTVILNEKVDAIHLALKNMGQIDYMAISWDSNLIFKEKQRKDNAELVRTLRRLYGECHNIKEFLNTIYGGQLLITIALVFCETVYFVFLQITVFQFSGTGASLLTRWKRYHIGSVTITQIMKLLLTVGVCQQWKTTAEKTGTVVHETIDRINHKETRKELLLFSTELQHRNPKITASGFCEVDFGMLAQIIGAVLMYIIILIQFRFPVNLDIIDPIVDMTWFA